MSNNQQTNSEDFVFGRENYKWMIIGILVMIVGFILMAGGSSEDPSEFHPEEVYSFRRITLAPILVLLGYVIEVYAIFKKS